VRHFRFVALKKQAFSDALHQGLSIDTHIQVFWEKILFEHFLTIVFFSSCDANIQIWHFRFEIEKIPR
jgi:hypothetical protein